MTSAKPKRLILPRAVGRRFAAYARAFYAAPSKTKAHAVSVEALNQMRKLYPGRLRRSDILRMFAELSGRPEEPDRKMTKLMRRNVPTVPFRRRPVEIPAAIGQRFVANMRAFHAESDRYKRDEIASHTLRMLRERYPGKLRLLDVWHLFDRLRDELDYQMDDFKK